VDLIGDVAEENGEGVVGWLEELDQFSGPEEIRNVEQSLFRGGSYPLAIKTFNPPEMAWNSGNISNT